MLSIIVLLYIPWLYSIFVLKYSFYSWLVDNSQLLLSVLFCEWRGVDIYPITHLVCNRFAKNALRICDPVRLSMCPIIHVLDALSYGPSQPNQIRQKNDAQAVSRTQIMRARTRSRICPVHSNNRKTIFLVLCYHYFSCCVRIERWELWLLQRY